MRLVIIRHGDPDYEHDSLTKAGRREARLVANRVAKMDVKEFFVSPLGRAKVTASYTLRKMGRTATESPWLREFNHVLIDRPDITTEQRVAWDWLPADWTARPHMFDKDHWLDDPAFQAANLKEAYDFVVNSLDELLEKHGYKRNGLVYDAVRPNTDTLVFFCHFGVECVLLSHLMNVSPMILWHHTAALPSSVTEVVTEERRPGVAAFRAISFGDTSHLYKAGVEPSFSGRFREVYSDETQRRDDYNCPVNK